MQPDPVVIAGIARTPMGSFQGELAGAKATQLGATAVAAALDNAGIDAADVDEAYMGCVLPAGLGQAPARQAALGAGIPDAVRCTTINKMCGSGMQAAILANDVLLAGSATVIAKAAIPCLLTVLTSRRVRAECRTIPTAGPTRHAAVPGPVRGADDAQWRVRH